MEIGFKPCKWGPKPLISVSEGDTRKIAAELCMSSKAGDIILLEGPLGAGKTTFVRGFLEALGHEGPVRSPTFNLIQTFATDPPVMHSDLYRVKDAAGIGLEEYFDSHVCLIEWPDRLGSLIDGIPHTRIKIDFDQSRRSIEILQESGD